VSGNGRGLPSGAVDVNGMVGALTQQLTLVPGAAYRPVADLQAGVARGLRMQAA